MSLSLRYLECKCRQQLWWFLSAATLLLLFFIILNSLQTRSHSVFAQMVCGTICMYNIFFSSFLRYLFFFPLFSMMFVFFSRSLVVSNVILLLLLFYCRLCFCILHKWINYVASIHTVSSSFVYACVVHPFFVTVTLCHGFVWCGDVFVSGAHIENWLIREKIYVPAT